MPLRTNLLCVLSPFIMAAASSAFGAEPGPILERLKYNHPGLVVDLGVGLWAWPLPMDYDGDGDLDLVVSCPDFPYKGTYLFENPGGNAKMPVFKPAVRLGTGYTNIRPSYVGGQGRDVRLLTPGRELVDFRRNEFSKLTTIYPKVNLIGPKAKLRANQWHLVDYDGDGDLDLIVGTGDWADYGWDDAFDRDGNWTRGPLHGRVSLVRNLGTDAKPNYADPVLIEAGGEPIDVFGMPSPNFADFDGDGDLDLICGEFLDGFTYFENLGSRTEPRYAQGRRLVDESNQPVKMHLQMIVPVAIDWDGDGDVDLIVGDEDGRVALVEHTGKVVDGLPRFHPPVYFQQEADDLKFGALVTPCATDWDDDGDTDLICGDSAGNIALIENLDGGDPPKWAAPRLLEADGKAIRIMAGPNGSIQGPCEAKWGYTQPSVADWDGDGDLDVVVNSIWGKVVWFRNIGSRAKPVLAPAEPVEVNWPGAPPKPAWTWWTPGPRELATQWRTTPHVTDWNGDGLTDLVMLDHEGFLAFFERFKDDSGALRLQPGKRIFLGEPSSAFDSRHRPQNEEIGPLQLNNGTAGASGRRTFQIADWDGDGRPDLIVDSKNANVLKNTGASDGLTTFQDAGPVADRVLTGHTTRPTVVDWNKDGVPDLVIGAEDGRFYYLKNSR